MGRFLMPCAITRGGLATGIAAGISVRMGGCIVQWHAHVALMLARISSPLVLAWARGDSALRVGVGARFVVVTSPGGIHGQQ